MPNFASQSQEKSIPSARQKISQTSTTETLNWEDEQNVMVIDGRRLTIPGLNRMASFKSEDIYTKKHSGVDAPSSPSSTEDELNRPYRSNV